jgi:hypothetical protein
VRVEPQPGSFDFPIRFSEFVRGLGFARSTVFADRTSDLFGLFVGSRSEDLQPDTFLIRAAGRYRS